MSVYRAQSTKGSVMVQIFKGLKRDAKKLNDIDFISVIYIISSKEELFLFT